MIVSRQDRTDRDTIIKQMHPGRDSMVELLRPDGDRDGYYMRTYVVYTRIRLDYLITVSTLLESFIKFTKIVLRASLYT